MALPLPPALPGEKRAGNLVAFRHAERRLRRNGARRGRSWIRPTFEPVRADLNARSGKNRSAGSGCVFGRPVSACGSQASCQASHLYPAVRELRGGALLTQAQRELSGYD